MFSHLLTQWERVPLSGAASVVRVCSRAADTSETVPRTLPKNALLGLCLPKYTHARQALRLL